MVIGAAAYPETVQRIQVQPNELEKEREYIQRNIDMTRRAFALDSIEEKQFPAAPDLESGVGLRLGLRRGGRRPGFSHRLFFFAGPRRDLYLHQWRHDLDIQQFADSNRCLVRRGGVRDGDAAVAVRARATLSTCVLVRSAAAACAREIHRRRRCVLARSRDLLPRMRSWAPPRPCGSPA